MRALLINPPNTFHPSTLEEYLPADFPLGLAYIAGVFRERGHDVKVIDAFVEGLQNRSDIDDTFVHFGLADDVLIRQIKDWRPDLVAITAHFSCQYHNSLHVARLVRQVSPKIVTVCGGAHATALPHGIDPEAFDYVMLGEAEFALPDLAEHLAGGNGSPLPHGAVKTGDATRPAGEPAVINNLDDLPWPAYDLMPLPHYFHPKRVLPFLTTRGCPFHCNFCSARVVMGHKIRRRSIETVLDELAMLRKDHGIERVNLEDDNLTANMNWAKELFRRLADLKLGIRAFPRNGIRADRVDRELLTLMKHAGVDHVVFAPESGSQEVLDTIIDKRLSLETVERSVRLAHSVGLTITCFMVIGFPGETLDQIKTTIRYGRKLLRMGADVVTMACATPHPGTALWQQCVEMGLVADDMDFRRLLITDPLIPTEAFTTDQLLKIRNDAVRTFARTRKLRRARTFVKNALKTAVTDPRRFLTRARQVVSSQPGPAESIGTPHP